MSDHCEHRRAATGRTRKSRVYLIDAYATVRTALALYLEEVLDVDIVGHSHTVSGALGKIAATAPDVLLISDPIPGEPPVAACARVVASYPQLAVLMLTASESEVLGHRVLDVGARGFVSKSAGGESLRQAIDAVQCGGAVMKVGRSNGTEMSRRELELLSLMADGSNYEEIADQLSISYHTAISVGRQVRQKLGAENGPHCVALAIRRGLL